MGLPRRTDPDWAGPTGPVPQPAEHLLWDRKQAEWVPPGAREGWVRLVRETSTWVRLEEER